MKYLVDSCDRDGQRNHAMTETQVMQTKRRLQVTPPLKGSDVKVFDHATVNQISHFEEINKGNKMTIFNKSRRIKGLRITHEYGTTEWIGKRFMLYVILKKAFRSGTFRTYEFVSVKKLSDKAWDVNCSFVKNIPFSF